MSERFEQQLPFDQTANLSPAGEARRERILQLAQGAARHRRFARRLRKSALALFVATGAMAFTTRWVQHRSDRKWADRQPPAAPSQVVRQGVPAPLISPVVISWIRTESGIADRLSISSQPHEWQVLSDTDLVQDLSRDGKPVGLAYADGHEVLVLPQHPTP